MDRLLTLEVFTAVVDKGSFVAAARALDLSPASVTEHIQELEKRLKTKLLNRTSGASRSPRKAQRTSSTVAGARAWKKPMRCSPRSAARPEALRVQGPQVLVNGILLPRFSKFLERYAELSVEFSISPAMPDLVQQSLDLAILINPDPSPGVIFPADRLVRGAHLRFARVSTQHGKPKHPDDLSKHSVIGVRTSPGVYLSSFRFQHDGKMISRTFPSRVTVDLGDGPALAALAGVGIGQSYNYAVAHHLEEGRLVPVLDDWSWSGPPLGAVHLPNRFLSPKVQVFLDFVKESLGTKVSPYRADWDNR